MSEAAPPEPKGPVQPLPLRALKAISDAVSQPSSRSLDTDFLGPLTEEEDKVLGKHWPNATPTGDGVNYLDQWMKIRAGRWRWRARIATGGEIVWLAGKVASLVVCVGFAWENFVR